MWNIETEKTPIGADIVIVTMNSGKVNAMNPKFFETMNRTLNQVESMDIDGMVITSSGTTFCAGLDLPTLYEFSRTEMDSFIVNDLGRTLRRFLRFPIPTVAAINGHAIAGGCVLGLACDFRIGIPGNFRIGLNEILIGIPFPTIPMEIVRHALPIQTLRRLIFSGALFSPEEALQNSLIDEIVPASDLIRTAYEAASKLPLDSLHAYHSLKKTMNQPILNAIDADGGKGDQAFLDAWYSEAGQRRIRESLKRLDAKKN